MLTITLCRSECCVPSGLDFKADADSAVRYFVSSFFASRALTQHLSHCTHDMGALSWLNADC